MSSDNPKPQDVLDSLAGAKNNPEILGLLEESRSKNQLSGTKLDLKDFLALMIALMETVFLPIVLLMGVLVGFALLLQILANIF